MLPVDAEMPYTLPWRCHGLSHSLYFSWPSSSTWISMPSYAASPVAGARTPMPLFAPGASLKLKRRTKLAYWVWV